MIRVSKFSRNCIIIFIIFCLVLLSRVSVRAESNSGETFVSYAMKFNENPNIPYVYDGPGRGHTLEDCDANKLGTDCSGFCSSILIHFGIIQEGTAWDSDGFKTNAVSGTTNIDEALPGDFCVWDGHVAMYIGDDKIIHTNTAHPGGEMPTNYIHITKLSDYSKYLNGETYFARVTNDTSLLGQGDSSNDVASSKSKGSVQTDSDLTGMPIESTLKGQQEMIELYGADDLSLVDGNSLQTIKKNMEVNKIPISNKLGIISELLGYLCCIYASLVIISAIFDYTNSWFDFSLLGFISFNRWRIVSKSDIEDGLVADGYDKTKSVTYMTAKMLVFRIVLVFIIGLVLISGVLISTISDIILRFVN